MRQQLRRPNWSEGSRVVVALVLVVLVSAVRLGAQAPDAVHGNRTTNTMALKLSAQAPRAVHGSGTTNTIPLWTSPSTIGNSALTQSGNNISLPGTFTATGFICPACVGNVQLSINYAGSPSQGGAANNALNLGGLSPSSFAQLGAGNNSFAGSMSVGGTLSANTFSANSPYQIGGTPVLAVGPPASLSLYVGQSAGGAAFFGVLNTAVGGSSLFSNTSGNFNTAIGANALLSNKTSQNTAVGASALSSNTFGSENAAVGAQALISNTTGSAETAIGGGGVLSHSTTGPFNTAVGWGSLFHLTTGDSNVAVGVLAGANFTGSESHNIDLGNEGMAGESRVIRIGGSDQTATYIAGIFGVTTSSTTTSPVLVDSNGQLGTLISSRRYKEDIQDMAAASDGLLRLRPVTFRYKKPYADSSKPIQYGLIAEEVAEVYPDLVVNGKDGQPETVQYYKLDAMLLNELQKLAKLHAADQSEIAKLRSEVAEQQATMKQLQEQIRVVQLTLAKSQPRDGNERAGSALAPEGSKPTTRK